MSENPRTFGQHHSEHLGKHVLTQSKSAESLHQLVCQHSVDWLAHLPRVPCRLVCGHCFGLRMQQQVTFTHIGACCSFQKEAWTSICRWLLLQTLAGTTFQRRGTKRGHQKASGYHGQHLLRSFIIASYPMTRSRRLEISIRALQ